MTDHLASRLPYAEPASPGDLHRDCRAVGANLHLDLSPTQAVPVPAPRTPLTTSYAVPDAAARLAGSLHLHLD